MSCPVCGGLQELVPLPEIEGRAEEHGIEVYGLRGRGCSADDHPRTLLSPHFAADLLAELLHGDALPTGRTAGLLRKRRACGGCGATIEGAPAVAGTLRCRVRVGDTPPCTVTLHAPLVTCPGCGLQQVASAEAAQAPLAAALQEALAAAGVSP